MKYFSILFTVLFFLSFASITYAESVLITINKDSDSSSVFIEDNIPLNEIEEKLSWFSRKNNILDIYRIEPDACVKVSTRQFGVLSIVSDDGVIDHTTLCSAHPKYKNICQPNNYEIINDGGLFDNHVMQAVDQRNPNYRYCMDIEKWMKLKEIYFLSDN